MRRIDDARWLLPLACALAAPAACAQQDQTMPLVEALGGAGFSHWRGVQAGRDGTAVLRGPAEFRYPDGPRGFYSQGFRRLNDGTRDWRAAYGVQVDVLLPTAAPRELAVAVLPADPHKAPVKAKVTVQGAGWHTLTLPWSAFDIETARTAWLLHVKGLSIDAGGAPLTIRAPRVTMGARTALAAQVRGKSVAAGGTAEYMLSVGNPTRAPQSVALAPVRYGWEKMAVAVTPALVSLRPGETRQVTVRVTVPDDIPHGGLERQVVRADAHGDAAAAVDVELVTASAIAGPHLLFTAPRWAEVRAKAATYGWAQEERDKLVKAADAWQVPEMASARHGKAEDTLGPWLVQTSEEQGLMASAIAWQLTRERRHADKVALFMRRLADPATGYPSTYRASNNSLVQEGHLFQHIAMAYDMIKDAGAVTAQDQANVEHTFRLLMETMDRARGNGNINNWTVSEVTGAMYCALALGDFAAAERFFKGPSGILDQLAKGTMDDGWWNEASISYNTWVASEFTQAALALQNWGVNFKDMWVPASYSEHVLLDSEMAGGAPAGAGKDFRPFGMTNEVWGPHRKSYRSIADLWNSLLPFLDYRGVMFGVNDSTENKVGGYRTEIAASPFELAYYAYRDPRYAAIVKTASGKRDLLYGVPDLPPDAPAAFRESAVADNTGLVMLRSRSADKPDRERIQAVLHYGSHGWAHGHFDRTGLLSLMRYGRSFYNPEASWYGYAPFMYKFYVQTSLAHNMVVVDDKMQEASPGERTLFYTGKRMGATAVETTTRWSNPPYGGMVYADTGITNFADKTWNEGRYVPIPKDAPAYGSLTGYTEPILQRRVMVVTDYYVVLADYVKGDRPHVYDNLLQLKGFQGFGAPGVSPVGHDKQWNPDPLGSGQFVTDVDRYAVSSPARATFVMRFGPGADNAGTRALYSEDGVLAMDVHTLYPAHQDILVGAVPEDHRTEKRLFYTVRGDGKPLADGKFGAWILGEAAVDVPLAGVGTLELETRTEGSKANTLFWANARIVTAQGREIPLSQLPVGYDNVVRPPQAGKDYYGGPIKIVGTAYTEATAAEPKDAGRPGKVRIDLTGLDAVRFKSVIGGDYPLGNEAERRKTFGVRQQGVAARFLTLIEPHEGRRMVKSAVAVDADTLEVTLADGRTQRIALSNVDGDGRRIGVKLTEIRDGRVSAEESTAGTATAP
jgi:hypothetical protein